MSADQIMGVERALAARSLCQGDVDGLWGPKTQHAVLNFQVPNDLTANGEPTPWTSSALGVSKNGHQAGVAQAGQTRRAASWSTQRAPESERKG